MLGQMESTLSEIKSLLIQLIQSKKQIHQHLEKLLFLF